MEKQTMATMYHDKNILGLITASIASFFIAVIGNINASTWALFFGSFGGLCTGVAALIKARKDWVEGGERMKPRWWRKKIKNNGDKAA